MVQPNVTTLAEIQQRLGRTPNEPDTRPEVKDAYEAAEAFVAARCRWAAPSDSGTVAAPPADLVKAVELLTRRYISRNSSPDGLVQMGDLGPGRIPASDRDVDALMRPYRRVVFG